MALLLADLWHMTVDSTENLDGWFGQEKRRQNGSIDLSVAHFREKTTHCLQEACSFFHTYWRHHLFESMTQRSANCSAPRSVSTLGLVLDMVDCARAIGNGGFQDLLALFAGRCA